MTRVRSVLAGRGFLLFPAAAFAVHQLRYELGYGARSGAALAAQGHGYENSLAPWVVVLLALALGVFLARLAGAAAGRGHRGRRSVAALCGLTWALLLATYCVQEWLEGVFASGHPAGLTGVFGHGGWWAVPLSAVAALTVAALLAAASAAVELVATAFARRTAVSTVWQPAPSGALAAVRLSPLACSGAGRAPPRPTFG